MKLVGTSSLALAALLWIHTASTMDFPGHLNPRGRALSVMLTGLMAIAWMWWHLFGREQLSALGARREPRNRGMTRRGAEGAEHR